MYITLIVKTFMLYFFILVVYRFMGKKELGELNIIDFIVSILIAELAAISIEEETSSILISIIPICVLVILQIVLSYISLKSTKIRDMLDGKPSVIIKGGKINFSLMKKLRYSLEDLLTQLRGKGVSSLEDVSYAVLENSGTLSIFEKKEYPLPLILDGVVDYYVLKEIKKDKKWLLEVLHERNLKLNNVFYAFYHEDKLFIIKKEEVL